MKTLKTLVLMGCATLMVAGSTQAQEGRGAPQPAKVRVGTYDSRSVAVAYAGSDVHRKVLAARRAEYEKAKAMGDQTRVAELEAEGKAGQKLMHKQGFSTTPVDDILERVKDRLPVIQEKAGVVALVSKWDKTGLARYEDAELLDVTMALVDALRPNDRQRTCAIEIQKHEPIPLGQAENIRD